MNNDTKTAIEREADLQQSYGKLEADTPQQESELRYLLTKKKRNYVYVKDTPEEMKILIRELEELGKQIEALQDQIHFLKIKLIEATAD